MLSCDWLLDLVLLTSHDAHRVILYFNIYCDFYLYYFNLFFRVGFLAITPSI